MFSGELIGLDQRILRLKEAQASSRVDQQRDASSSQPKDEDESLSKEEAKLLEDAILAHDLDFDQLAQTTLEDLKEMGFVKIGPRMRALARITATVAKLKPASLASRGSFNGSMNSPYADLPLLPAGQPTPVPCYMSNERATIRQVTVPVYQTLLVKKLVEDPITGQVNLVGTIVQRPLYYDLANVELEYGKKASPYFNYRFNEGSDSDATSLILRKSVRNSQLQRVNKEGAPPKPAYSSIAISEDTDIPEFNFENGFQCCGAASVDGRNEAEIPDCDPQEIPHRVRDDRCAPPKDDASELSEAPFLTVSNTFQGNIPMVRHSVYEAHPFRIVAVELFLELSSTYGTLDGMPCEFRPDFVCHVGDKRNLVSVRDWDKLDRMDEMCSFDIINTSPAVEYLIEIKQGMKGSPATYYVPKMKVTWYLRSCAMQAFLESNVPILFVSLCNTLNLVYTGNYDEFLGNSLTIGITIVFIIPTLGGGKGFLSEFELNHLYVALLFLGVAFSVISVDPKEKQRNKQSTGDVYMSVNGTNANNETSEERQRIYQVFFVLSNLLMWGALVIPITNYLRYKLTELSLSQDPPREDSDLTFNGRPSKGNKRGSQIDFANLRNFYVSELSEAAPEKSHRRMSNSRDASTEALCDHLDSSSVTERLETSFSGTDWAFAHTSNKPPKRHEHPNIVRSGIPRHAARSMSSPLNSSRVLAKQAKEATVKGRTIARSISSVRLNENQT